MEPYRRKVVNSYQRQADLENNGVASNINGIDNHLRLNRKSRNSNSNHRNWRRSLERGFVSAYTIVLLLALFFLFKTLFVLFEIWVTISHAIVGSSSYNNNSTMIANWNRRPRTIIVLYDNDDDVDNSGWPFFENSNILLTTIKKTTVTIQSNKLLKPTPHLETSDDNINEKLEKIVPVKDGHPITVQKFYAGCELPYSWQKRSLYPTCNSFHEFDFLLSLLTPVGLAADNVEYQFQQQQHQQDNQQQQQEQQKHRFKVEYTSHGSFRDVWKVLDTHLGNQPIALKTLVYTREYQLIHYDQHRIDAVVSERLTKSPYIASIYSACANSGMFEYANGGNLHEFLTALDDDKETPSSLYEKLSSTDKLILAYQVAAAMADLHYHAAGDDNVPASIAHTDLKSQQFVYFPEQGILKLTDFNRCRFIAWNKESQETCSFNAISSNGKFRSPEEYKHLRQSYLSDVFMMGNIFYEILTGLEPFFDIPMQEAQQNIIDGEKPEIIIPYKKEKNREISYMIENVLLEATDMSWEYTPEKRTSALVIKNHLYKALKQLQLVSHERDIPRIHLQS